MIYPIFIKENSYIGVPAPSAGANVYERQNRMLNAKINLENLGYRIIMSKNILNSEKGRSAKARERANEINEMFKNKDIEFILCATGGEFLVEILPFIDFDLIKENPKFVAGFSDPTGLLYPITTKYDIATIYGQNFSSFGSEKCHQSQKDFLEIIKGNIVKQYSYDFYEEEYGEMITGLEGYNLTKEVYWNTLDEKEVLLKGRIIGGCLDIISELAGTKHDGINEFNEKYKENGIIWYFDNCELSMEELIRTLWKLNEFGYFKYTKGIIFGRNGHQISSLDYTMEEALRDSVIGKMNIPVLYDTDISHKGPCMTIINGAVATVSCENGKGNISFELK